LAPVGVQSVRQRQVNCTLHHPKLHAPHFQSASVHLLLSRFSVHSHCMCGCGQRYWSFFGCVHSISIVYIHYGIRLTCELSSCSLTTSSKPHLHHPVLAPSFLSFVVVALLTPEPVSFPEQTLGSGTEVSQTLVQRIWNSLPSALRLKFCCV